MFADSGIIAAYMQQKYKLFSSTRYYLLRIHYKNLFLDNVRCIFITVILTFYIFAEYLSKELQLIFSSQSKDLIFFYWGDRFKIITECLQDIPCIFNLLSLNIFATYSLNIRRLLTNVFAADLICMWKVNISRTFREYLVSHIRLYLQNNCRMFASYLQK